MKNLFKNLMLVAVAAMAFTACTEENNEVNAVAKKTVVNGVAIIDADDTRSGFVGSETTDNGDGTTTTKYKSAWDGGETIKLFADGGLATTATIDAEGEGKFSAEFEGELPASFYMTVCSPAEAWSDASIYAIPAEQTPRENSVDPAAHILKAQNVYVTNGTADYFSMEHQVAYGKMTVNTPAEFVIDHVDIKLNGLFYGYDRNLSYTINADNVVNNTFWFATEVINVTDFTVTAYDAEDNAYTKSVTIAEGKALNFNYGHVSTFSVSNLEPYKEPAEVYDYTYAYVSNTWGDTDKLVTFTADGKEDLNVNFAGRSFDGNAIAAGTYSYDDGVYKYGITFGDYFDNNTAKVTVETMDSVVVSIVDGCYVIEFNNLKDYYGNVLAERLTFKGTIEGLDIPDPRTPLATPELTYELNGKTLTLSWAPVDGAVGYYVHDYYKDVDTTTTDTTLTVDLTEYKWHYFYVSAIAPENDPNYKNSAEDEISFELKDPRVILPAPTNIAATVDGKYATITWDPVQGADYYYVEYYMDGTQSTEVTDASVTLEIGYSKSIWVYVVSKANEDNPDYRSSTSWDCYVQVNTDRDPNVFADFMYDTLSWNSQYSRFELTGNGNDMTQFYVNSSDSPNHNSIKARTYTYAGNTVQYPAEGQFSLRYLLGSGAGSQHYVYDASMEVKIENGQYSILITILDAGNSAVKGKTFGYKGLPNDFVLPGEGGDDNTGDGGETTDPENPGEGGGNVTPDQGESWSVAVDGLINSRYTNFRFTRGSDVITGMFVYANKAQIPGLYEVESETSYNNHKISEVRLNGIYTDTEEGTVNIEMTPDGGYKFTLNLTLNGTQYTGTALM